MLKSNYRKPNQEGCNRAKTKKMRPDNKGKCKNKTIISLVVIFSMIMVIFSSVSMVAYADHNPSIYNVKHFGAKGDGVTDDTAAIQAAINAASAGTIVYAPPGTYMLSSTLNVGSSLTFELNGTLKPLNTGTAGNYLINITSGDVTFKGTGGIDGNSTLWNGIIAENDSTVIENVVVDGLTFKNMAIDTPMAAFVIHFSSIKNGQIKNNRLYNCGVVGNVNGGGYGIYTQFNQNTIIKNNSLEKVGSSGITVASGMNNVVTDNSLSKITLFGCKAGFGESTTVTGDITPSATSFSITKDSKTTRQWFVGTYFLIALSDNAKTTGYVKAITDNGTYYTITSTTLDSVPVAGKKIKLPDTGTKWVNNSITYTGDNGFDINITNNTLIEGNTIKYAGWYQDAGIFQGLRTGIWIGADPQPPVTCYESEGVIIKGNTVQNTAGSAIAVFSTRNVIIDANYCRNYNEYNDPTSSTAAYGGIEVGRLGYGRIENIKIANNICYSPYGYGIYAGFFLNGVVSDNIVRSKAGIKLNSPVASIAKGNMVEALGDSSYALLVSDDSGANPTSGVQIVGNNLRVNGGASYAVKVSDVSATGVMLTNDNSLYVPWNSTEIENLSSTKLIKEEYVTLADTPVISNLYENADGHYKGSVSSGGTTTIASFNADLGTAGMVEIIGVIRAGTSDAEVFRAIAWGGYLANNALAFTSLGIARGSAFLASADFSVIPNGTGGLVDVKYTNNEANTVYISCEVKSISRF